MKSADVFEILENTEHCHRGYDIIFFAGIGMNDSRIFTIDRVASLIGFANLLMPRNILLLGLHQDLQNFAEKFKVVGRGQCIHIKFTLSVNLGAKFTMINALALDHGASLAHMQNDCISFSLEKNKVGNLIFANGVDDLLEFCLIWVLVNKNIPRLIWYIHKVFI